MKWAVCKREDVVRFKADLVGHTESIQMILSVIQMQVFDDWNDFRLSR